ncbi:MBL fold metallo-hydrolase [Flaviaesturariibacter amylovorans]|uniref:MBL fold metallo-hydrolase n=1 Tax=Flaviaesturariibacter amylovorans TaxID=1084520 RepID=A0ABP8HFB4_9BACT
MLFVYLLLGLLGLALLFVVAGFFFMRRAPFGATARGARAARRAASPHFRNGQFQNLAHTPQLTEGVSMGRMLIEFFFTRNPRKEPPAPLPAVRAELRALDPAQDALVWFGHSSYFLQLSGKTFLVDPVLSGSASPVSFTTRAFKGADAYGVDDLPAIDYLILTHDHWDHLDYETVKALRSRVKYVITGLGTGAHLERWGYAAEAITELDWWEETDLEPGFRIGAAPARHFSGRGLRRNGVLWSAFVLRTPARQLFLGGDSGPGDHFKSIRERWGRFDLALLECGQYNQNWKYIHMTPEEGVAAAIDLGAAALMPVHWGKFSLAMHDWDEPITRSVAEARRLGLPVLHPRIGEVLLLDAPGRQVEWWKEVKTKIQK